MDTLRSVAESPVLMGVLVSISYSLVYFWRYPIFILPPEVLREPVGTIFGHHFDLQTAFSVVFTLGFGLAKFPAVFVMTGQHFYARRLPALATLMAVSMLISNVGVYVFADVPLAQVACVFVGCFFQSWIWGGMFTYLEGRRVTEVLVAIATACYAIAGPLARATARYVLELGVPPHAMPLAIGLVCCPPAMLLLALVDCSPAATPSPEDVRLRAHRKPVTAAGQRRFVRENWFGLACLILSLTLMTGLRSLRNFFSQDIFTSALALEAPPAPSFFFLVDVPGSAVSCAAIFAFKAVRDNRAALLGMLAAGLGCVAALGAANALFEAGAIAGRSWCVLTGLCIYTAYGVMAGPVYDRLVAATRFDGTCTFLIYLSDGTAYAGTIVLLMYQVFGPKDGTGARQTLNVFLLFVYVCSALMLLLIVVGATYYSQKLPPTPADESLGGQERGPLLPTGAETPDCEQGHGPLLPHETVGAKRGEAVPAVAGATR